ncbi:MAG: trans-aconitate 2-methyltransferase [Gammaproteobacteria bacterium RIFCSPHIGHO2_12_FULL_37_14]|nr:MAG: trans-aconitate 2-methyltransferase [Gammaproteobacteria bacterium RIFCSPHIGHO2_12_FULL_37_14]
MKDIWQAKQYSRYLVERTQPATDLLARIPKRQLQEIVDLGCGTGNSTFLLKKRWPKAHLIGMDNSLNMLEQAKAIQQNIEWLHQDIATWQPKTPPDLFCANASLQWLSNHETIIPRLFHFLNKKGILAVQMPCNYHAPSHRVLLEVILHSTWRKHLLPLLQYGEDRSPVGTPEFYYTILAPLSNQISIWQTQYLVILSGEDPVIEWMKGTTLRPILNALDQTEQQNFLKIYSDHLKKYYPKQANGHTLFSFNRIFFIAERNN